MNTSNYYLNRGSISMRNISCEEFNPIRGCYVFFEVAKGFSLRYLY
jgi:hypothetical protein